MTAPLAQIRVGIIVERRKAASQWIDYLWRPVTALAGQPQTQPWTVLSQDESVTTYYAGAADVAFYKSETSNYRDNLAGDRALWVILRPAESDPPYQLFAVTADPSEGEAFTETGADLVEKVPLPNDVRTMMVDFVAEHHVEHTFQKRKRDRADPEALGRRGPAPNKDER